MITLQSLGRYLSPIKRSIFLLIGRALLTAINNSETYMKIQVESLKDEPITDMERPQNYGFESYPIVGNCEAFCVFINGNRDQGLALVVSDKNRPKDLNPGDVCLWNVKGDRFILDNTDGLIRLENQVTSLKEILENFSTEGGPTRQFTSSATKLEINKLFK